MDGGATTAPDLDPAATASPCGDTPVRAEGFVSGRPQHFRSRGNRRSIEAGRRDGGEVPFRCGEPYGDAPSEAGWIRHREALALPARGPAAWHAFDRAARPGRKYQGLAGLLSE